MRSLDSQQGTQTHYKILLHLVTVMSKSSKSESLNPQFN